MDGSSFDAEVVAELELDHTGYVVCQKPSSYVVEEALQGAAVAEVEMYMESDVMNGVEDVIEANSIVVVGRMVMVCCPAAVTVTVAAAGVTVTTEISIVSCPVTIAVEVIVAVPAGTISVETTVIVVCGASGCVTVSITVVIAPGDPPAVAAGDPPSTGTTEYDALGVSNGSG